MKKKKNQKKNTGTTGSGKPKHSAHGRTKESPLIRPATAIQPADVIVPADRTIATNHDTPEFPIVGIGASAGGFQALQTFFEAMPANTGLSFVVVVHLYPGRVSLLPELLSSQTSMSVMPATDGAVVLPNCVYIIPTDKDLEIKHGVLKLKDSNGRRADNFPIDRFFRSLAADQGKLACYVILSGTGSDGSEGLNSARDEHGLILAQDEESAKFNGMPESAISTGLVDFVLTPQEMPSRLILFSERKGVSGAPQSIVDSTAGITVEKILELLRTQTGHDFSQYKKNTILRRIDRRLSMHQMSEASNYLKYLQSSPEEVELLLRDLMIGVTRFFRDPTTFEQLKTNVFPGMFGDRRNSEVIRIWVAACSTGEEAYSFAIALHESMEAHGSFFPVQIFATDINEVAIGVARCGAYGFNISEQVSPERLSRYFDSTSTGYQIKKNIREMIVFAPQNLIKDPPFTKLDLLSCRNLLIYLNSDLQSRLLSIFHYSLKFNGTLTLGSSESIGSATNLFWLTDKKWKIFTCCAAPLGQRPTVEFPVTGRISNENAAPIAAKKSTPMDELQLIESILDTSGTSPCVVINADNNLLYIHGRTGRFLEPPQGKASVNLVDMARESLRIELTSAIRQARTNRQEVVCRGLRLLDSAESDFIDLIVRPIRDQTKSSGMLLVIFSESSSPSTTPGKPKPRKGKLPSVDDLELELQRIKEHLQATIEELEASNEEHKSVNEELQSTNEELQSTNEELETSKEELQSVNEESATVNAELQSHVDELSKSNDDIKNLFDSTTVATLFLDLDLKISRFTPATKTILPLTTTDIGRPIGDLATTLNDVNLTEASTQVLDDLMMREQTLKATDGSFYLLRVCPYRTIANAIDGVVLTFEDITDRKRAEDKVLDSEKRFRTIFNLASDSIVLIDAITMEFCEANLNAYDNLGYTLAEFNQMKVTDIGAARYANEIRLQVSEVMKNGRDTFKTKHRKKNGEFVDVKVNIQALSLNNRDYLLASWNDLTTNNRSN